METMTIEEIHRGVAEVLEVDRKQLSFDLKKLSGQRVLILSIHALNTATLKSVQVITKDVSARDAAVLTRTIFESALNMGLLSILPPDMGVDRYEMFGSIEILRIHRDRKGIDKRLADRLPSLEQIPRLEEIEAEYKKRFGVPKQSWSGMNNPEVCRKLDEHYPEVMGRSYFFQYMYSIVYRLGSHAVHGTKMGLWRNVVPGGRGFMGRTQALIFNYFLALISYLVSIRIAGRAVSITSLESYFRERIDYLMEEYA